MPQVSVSVEADVATWSSGIAAGAGNHLPIGVWGSADYRSAMRFPLPAGFAGWTTIVKAVLSFYISDHSHVGVRDSSIYIRRQSVGAGLWTKSAGTQNCESGFSAANNTQYDDIVGITTDQYTFQSGSAANAKKSVNVTGIVRAYHGAGATKLVFVFDNVGSDDYTELWADEKSGYDATLVIDYEVQAVPDAPTLTAPADGATVVPTQPTYDWTHNDPQGDAQTQAEVRRFNSTGGTLQNTHAVAGSASALVSPDVLTRGTTYQWDVRTNDGSGWGPYSAKRTFTVKAAPVTTIDATRYMEYSNGAPRLRVKWAVTGGTQQKYRIQTTTPTSDTGWVASASQSVLLSGVNLVNGTATGVTVTVETTDILQSAAASHSFTPRWGLTVHRRDLTAAPVGWGTPLVVNTVPAGASLVIEYGSAATAVAAPTLWYSSLSSVPKARYVFWRAWFIPNGLATPALASPVLDKITIPANFTVEVVDKWYGNLALAPIAPPWGVDTGEYVYGTRSLTREGNGAVGEAFSSRIKVRAGRSYILTGLMRSEGNSEALFMLWDPAIGSGLASPTGDIIVSETLSASRDWFEADRLDVHRYRTPVWLAPQDMEVVIRLRAGGAVGTQAWWDAIKLEESTVATPWSPGAIGATVIDAGGVQVDATKGGVFRLRGSAGAAGDVVELGTRGLLFGGDAHLYRSAPDTLKTDDRLDVGTLTPTNIRGVAALTFVFNGTLPGTGVQNLFWGDQAANNASMRMPFACEVVGISVAAALQRTAGSISVQVYNLSGAAFVGPAAVLDGTVPNLRVVTDTVSGVADLGAQAQMQVRVTATAFTPVVNSLVVTVWLSMVAE